MEDTLRKLQVASQKAEEEYFTSKKDADKADKTFLAAKLELQDLEKEMAALEARIKEQRLMKSKSEVFAQEPLRYLEFLTKLNTYTKRQSALLEGDINALDHLKKTVHTKLVKRSSDYQFTEGQGVMDIMLDEMKAKVELLTKKRSNLKKDAEDQETVLSEVSKLKAEKVLLEKKFSEGEPRIVSLQSELAQIKNEFSILKKKEVEHMSRLNMKLSSVRGVIYRKNIELSDLELEINSVKDNIEKIKQQKS